jgi:hypothetical protein
MRIICILSPLIKRVGRMFFMPKLSRFDQPFPIGRKNKNADSVHCDDCGWSGGAPWRFDLENTMKWNELHSLRQCPECTSLRLVWSDV